MQFVLQNCEILHSVRGRYDKNSASWYCFTSDVIYKEYKRKVYTSLDLLARFCKVNVSKAKIWPDLFSENLFSRPNLLLTRAIMAMLFFGCTYKAINLTDLLNKLSRFCKVNVSKAKIWPDLFSKNLFSRPNLLLTRAVMAMLFFGCTYKAINSINLTMT